MFCIRVSESRPYRTMTYLSADPSENECLLRDDTPCSYAPLLRMRTKYFNHHVRSKYLLRSKILNEVWERDVHLK